MSQLQELTDLLRRVCETPAPTFAEGTRGALVAGMLRDMGLSPHTDAVGNVTAEVPGGCGRIMLLC